MNPPDSAGSSEKPPGLLKKPDAPSLQKDAAKNTTSSTDEPYDPLRMETPHTLEDLGIRKDLLLPLVLKTIFVLDTFTPNEAAEMLCLPVKLTSDIIGEWKDLRCCEVLKSSSYASTTWRYTMTTEGRNRAREYLNGSGYVGPVPIPMDIYRKMVESQSVLHIRVQKKDLEEALSHLVVNHSLLEPLGPAINSGRSIFMYGPPGNGKTSIAVALAPLLGGSIAVPQTIEVDGFMVRFFDPATHIKEEGDQPEDRRWIRCKRPIVVVGGELTLETLELKLDLHSNTYEAPPHVKSNNGIFILDDFGRQLVRPRDLLNRWIVPLENRLDYLTLHTGNKFQVPFDQLTIFSTNINPKDLLDDAFMRRLRHKVYVGPLSAKEFQDAFRMTAEHKKMEFNQEAFDALIKEVYLPREIPFTGCHPRDLMDHIVDLAKFADEPPAMTKDLLLRACESYFVNPGLVYETPPAYGAVAKGN